jgi:ketose-bisphosphate aldolase
MLVTPQELFKKAQKGKYAIGAFNTSNIEITKGIIEAAQALNSPVIIETSGGEMDYIGPDLSVAQVRTLAQEANIPIALHLDHGKTLETCQEAIEAGYTSVHIDGSKLDYKENVSLTKSVVALAKKTKINVEGEIGHVPGTSERHDGEIDIEKDFYTDPELAQEFVKETGIDVLAVSIGNIHGIYAEPPQLDLERLSDISKKTGKYISLHGGSGIPREQIKKAISMGITKVNVNTELRLAFKAGILHEFDVNPEEVVPYKYLPAGREAVRKVVEAKIRLLGSAGKA